jgi:LPXTG-motif cell wall-anchored protein
MGKTALISLAIVTAVVAGVLIWWLTHQSPPPPDCSFTGWDRTVGVNLDAQVKDLDAVKGKLGISDSLVHKFDTLMQDYALKYDGACQDFRGKRISQGEYTCVRKNMDGVLDEIRRFHEAVEAAKALSDAAAQKEIVLKAFETLQRASGANYRSGCASSMNVNPKILTFFGNAIEAHVDVTNGGNNDFIFSVDGLPQGFSSNPISHQLVKGDTLPIVISRSLVPVPSALVQSSPKNPIKFRVRTNLNDEQEIAITIDSQNVEVWQHLGNQIQKESGKSASEITIDDALHAVSTSMKDSHVSDAVRYVLASTLLVHLHQDSAAKAALNIALERDPSLSEQPSTLLLSGIIANRERQPAGSHVLIAKNAPTPASDSAGTAAAGITFASSELPKTGSNLPLLGIVGLLLMSAAFVSRILAGGPR